MAPRTSTGIILRQHHQSGRWTLTRPGQATQNFDAAQTLDSICTRMGMGPGYWLRTTPEPGLTVWTWVEL